MSEALTETAARHCPRCRQDVPVAGWGRNRGNADGLAGYCRACVNAKGRERNARKAVPAAPRPCRHCLASFLPAHPNAHYCSEACRVTRQAARSRELSAAWHQANRDHAHALRRAWKAANRDRCRMHRAKHYHAFREQEHAAHRAWVERNRASLAAKQREYVLRKAALAEGKARFAGAGFFLLIRARTGFWRADVPGRPIGTTERIVARFEVASSESAPGKWVVYPPAIATEEQRRFAARLARLEQKSDRRRTHRYSTGRGGADTHGEARSDDTHYDDTHYKEAA